MKIRMMTAAGVVAVFAMTGITHANLLSNGDFTIEGTDSANAADWNEIFGSGWINREVHPNGITPDNYHYALGDWDAGNVPIANSVYQEVPATAGSAYELEVDTYSDPWEWATGSVKIEFRDSGGTVLESFETLFIPPGIHVGLPWTTRSISGLAPDGTTTVRAILGSVDGTGTIRFDNATLGILVAPDLDTDMDGLSDAWEIQYGLDPYDDGTTNVINGAAGDPDVDFLSNTNELVAGTNPQVADTDGDGLDDGEEVNVESTDPLDADSDDDLLTDGDEVNLHGTDPNLVDTDSDNANDATEVYAGSDPLSGASVPANALPEIIGLESFYYNNGAFGPQSGGELFDYDNSVSNDTYTGHTGSSSGWDTVFGTSYITAGRLETRESGMIRGLNGVGTGGDDIALFAQKAISPEVDAELLYAKVDITLEPGVSWGGVSMFASDVEELFFGVTDDGTGSNLVFRVEESIGISSNVSSIAPLAGTTYTMVIAMDAASGVASMWVDPVLASPEPVADIILSSIASTNLRCSAVRLASGGSGAIYWDNLVVGTTWDSLSASDSDSDLDGLWDAWENYYGLDPLDDGSVNPTNGAAGNPDADGFVNSDELANGTDPTLPDTDWDGLDDDVEVNTTFSDPLVWDTDDDGLNDGVEVNVHGTNPSLADTDADGEDDWFELFQGTDPNDPLSTSASEGIAIVDGTLDAAYGSAMAVQTLNTWVDNLDELDAAYAYVKNDRLFLMITGNMNTNWNSVEIFIDSSDAVTTNVFAAQGRDNTAAHMNGLVFDEGFSPDYHLYARIGTWGGFDGLSFNLDFADLGAASVSWQDNAFSDLPEGVGYMGPGDASSNTVAIGFNNSNVAGVVLGPDGDNGDPSAALAVTTGYELSIALADLGNPGAEIRILVMVTKDDHATISNQLLPGLPPSTAQPGTTTSVDFSTDYPGDQFFTVAVPLNVIPEIMSSQFISANTFIELNVGHLVKDVGYKVQETADLTTGFADVPGSEWTAAGTNETVTVPLDTAAHPEMFFRVIAP